MTPSYIAQTTVQYKTFLKRALVESLQESFTGHTDPTVAASKVGIDFTGDDFKLPAVIIKYYERELPNAGVGHMEWFPFPRPSDLDPTFVIPYQHRLYKGDVEFEVFGQSSADRDILTDALVEVFAMIEVSAPGANFIDRFYNQLASQPYGAWHFATLNTDNIVGYGEQTMPPPWAPEDDLVYQTAYRVPIFGEFYSYTPPEPQPFGFIEEVDVYPYIPGIDPDPQHVTSDAYYKFKGRFPGEKSDVHSEE